ncbi:MAG TPA: PIN domain-containing protein [Solirubrobacteraceae bacterium]
MIVLDASVLIAQFDARDAQHGRAMQALSTIAEEALGASTITLAEILVGPARAGRLEDARAALSDLAVDELPLPADAASKLAELRAQTDLRMPDCCVLLSAQQERASLLTFDDRMGKRAEQIGIPVFER